jgi:tRNA(Ile)-lysidine synthase
VSAAHPRARRRVSQRAFGPEWLRERLEALLPGFPRVSVCVALSGGIDSTALLAALARGRPRALRLRAAHVDHGLQASSALWSAHCQALARQLEVPLERLPVTVERLRGASLEEAARTARYRALEERLKPGETLLVAHTRDDQLETVLLQLLRGAGLAGLAAMPARSRLGAGWLARPLLTCGRAELEAWVRERGLPWVEDDSNADERFDRNFLRRRVLPAVRERWPGAAAAVARTARHAAQAQGLLESLARADVERASDGAALSVRSLRALSSERRRNALRFWIARSGRALPDTRRLDELAGPVIEARRDAHPRLDWGDWFIERHADLLSMGDAGRALESPRPPGGSIRWRWRGALRCELPQDVGALELKGDVHGPIDLDALPEELEVTWRRGGERLRVRPGAPRRALKSLLREAQVPIAERARLPLVRAAGELIAAGDLWVDAAVRAGPAARRRARLLWLRSPHARR